MNTELTFVVPRAATVAIVLFLSEIHEFVRLSSHWGALFILLLIALVCSAQETPAPATPAPSPEEQLKVNWLYGAYVPKEVALEPLTGQQRFKLYLRQSFTTPGIYLKTVLLSAGDQISNNPSEWGSDFAGYARRFGSRQSQFVIQNSFSAAGNALLGYEPRYDRCRCSGFWRRSRHAIVRNFITYDRSEKAIRPQLALYSAAFGAGAVAGTWKPSGRNLVIEGYRGVITQAGFGLAANLIGEFASDLKRMLGAKERSKDRRE